MIMFYLAGKYTGWNAIPLPNPTHKQSFMFRLIGQTLVLNVLISITMDGRYNSFLVV